MDTKTCPRCGNPVPGSTGTRGRPAVWCSPECRRLSSEERRAARSEGRVVEVREEIRERVVERSRPLSPDGAIDRVLSDQNATQKLLRVLAYRRRDNPPQNPAQKWTDSKIRPFLYDLWQAFHDADFSRPVATPAVSSAPPAATVDARRAAVESVLNSPRSIREVLSGLGDLAREGTLARSEYTATVRAAQALIADLYDAGLLSPLRR